MTLKDRMRQSEPMRVLPRSLHIGFNDGVRLNVNVGINHAGFRAIDAHTGGHQLIAFAQTKRCVEK